MSDLQAELGSNDSLSASASNTIRQYVFVDSYRPNADGSTDDYSKIASAITKAKSTTHKTLVFAPVEYFISQAIDVSGLRVIWNGCTIKGSSGYALITADGSIGTSYNLDSDAYRGDMWVECSNATLLSSLSVGDYVKIFSEATFSINETIKQGEIHRVRNISGNYIIFNDFLYDAYDTSDTAQIAKVNMTTVQMQGELNLEYTEYAVDATTAISFKQVRDLYMGSVNIKNSWSLSINLIDCVNGIIDLNTMKGDKDGHGYGLSIANACMNMTIHGTAYGHRHSVTFGGSDAYYGVSWNSIVRDGRFTTSLSNSTAIENHASCGSVIYQNCKVDGGVHYSLAGSITDWDGVTTFASGDYVRRGGFLFVSQQNGNLNHDPLTDYDCTWWKFDIGNTTVGYGVGARYCYIYDCIANNCYSAVTLKEEEMLEFKIDGLKIYNCCRGIVQPVGEEIGSIGISNVHLHNEIPLYMSTDPYAIQFSGTVSAWDVFTNIHVNNLHFLKLSGAGSLPDELIVDNFSCEIDNINSNADELIDLAHGSVDRFVFTNGKLKGGVNAVRVSHTGTIDSVKFQNVVFDNFESYPIYIYKAITDLNIEGCSFENMTLNYLIYLRENITNFVFTNCKSDTVSITNVAAGKTFTYSIENSNIMPSITNAHTGIAPTYRIFSGGVGDEWLLMGSGVPGGGTPGQVGTLYLNSAGGAGTTLYVKENGGWAAK